MPLFDVPKIVCAKQESGKRNGDAIFAVENRTQEPLCLSGYFERISHDYLSAMPQLA